MSNLPITHLTDEELFCLAGQNQAEAFGVIYDRYWPRLYAKAFPILEDREACKDIIQDVFIDLWNKRNDANITHIGAYLHQAVRFQVFKHLRRNNISQKHLLQFQQLNASNSTEETISFNEVCASLYSGINQLPEKCREVFYLSRFEQLSHREIAEKMGISSKTVENHLTKALRRLRAVVNDPVIILVFALFLGG
ncbi:MAG: RNA polymerase sigma-70 factor [Bacteroidia bacterium]